MPNQINITVNTSQTNDGSQIIENQTDAYTATGSLSQMNMQNISASWQQLSSSVSNNLAYLYLFNTSQTNTVIIATTTTASVSDILTPRSIAVKSWSGSGAFYASSSLSGSLGSVLHVLPFSF